MGIISEVVAVSPTNGTIKVSPRILPSEPDESKGTCLHPEQEKADSSLRSE